jgi:hypothetical protein
LRSGYSPAPLSVSPEENVCARVGADGLDGVQVTSTFVMDGARARAPLMSARKRPLCEAVSERVIESGATGGRGDVVDVVDVVVEVVDGSSIVAPRESALSSDSDEIPST